MLRDFQHLAVSQVLDAWKIYPKIILQLPTGAGKTHIAAHFIMEEKGHVAFLVERKTLVDQASKRFAELGIDHGINQADHPGHSPNKRVQIWSVQTLARRPHWYTNHGIEPSLVIVDEAHIQHRTTYKFMENHPQTKWLGLTATPWARGLGKHWQHLVRPVDMRTLTEQGYLVPYTAYGSKHELDFSNIRVMSTGEWDAKQLGEKMKQTEIVGDIWENWCLRAEGQPTLVSAVNIAHSKAIVEMFVSHGVPAAHIDAYTDSHTTRKAIKAFDSGDILVLSSVTKLAVGLDSPRATCKVLAKPIRESHAAHVQAIGRVLRPHPGKSRAILIDHGGNIQRLGFPEDIYQPELSTGSRSDSQVAKSERKVHKCKQCGFESHRLPTHLSPCLECGYAPEIRKSPRVIQIQGELVELERATINSRKPKDHVTWYRMLLGYAEERGYKRGWAWHTYKWQHKRSPPGGWYEPLPPTDAVIRFVKAMNRNRGRKKA